MFKLFSGEAADETSWPMREVVAALKNRFSDVDSLGEDGPLKVYGVTDNGINFVVALMQTGPGSQQVAELGFLARFSDFPNTAQAIDRINQNLHISVATIENNDLFLMAGMQVVGAFNETQFNLIIEQWRRDLAVCIHGLQGESASLTAAFPAAKLDAARQFATNRAPVDGAAGDGIGDIDMLSTFMGAERANQTICDECGGRGKRGLIARLCQACDGEGFVDGRR